MSGVDAADLGERLRSVARNDFVLFVLLMAAIYLVFIGFGNLLGYGLNGQFNALRRLTLLTAVYGLVVLALNLHWGYTGLFNIGVAGFMAVGAYTMAMTTAPPDAPIPGLGLPFWAGVLIGMAASAFVGLIAALPALRLRADYLAIVTIAFSEIIRISYLSSSLQTFTIAGVKLGTGGGRGIGIAEKPQTVIVSLLVDNPVGEALFMPVQEALRQQGVVPNVTRGWVYALFLLVAMGAVYWLLMRVGHSPFGRVLKAIREDEDVANALGKNTRRFKIKSFMLGCALMGLAGILWKGNLGFINPNTFLPQVTFFIWIALIIGGAGSNTGSVLGSALFASLLFEGPRFLANVTTETFALGGAPPTIAPAIGALASADPMPLLAYTLDNIAPLRLVLVGVVLIWLMQNRPEGLLGHRKEVAASIPLGRPDRVGSTERATAAADGGAPGGSGPPGADDRTGDDPGPAGDDPGTTDDAGDGRPDG